MSAINGLSQKTNDFLQSIQPSAPNPLTAPRLQLSEQEQKGQVQAVQMPKENKALQAKYGLNPNEHIDVPLGKYENAKFVPQSLAKTLIGKVASYALSKGDYFAGITILCEGITPKAFYYDPASGGRRGTLVNTHTGITLSLQTESTIRKLFKNTSISHMTDEIVSKCLGSNKGISPNMAQARLAVGDYLAMFEQIKGGYSKGAYNAIKDRLAHHPMAQGLLKSGQSSDQVMRTIQSQLPPSAYSVIQQISWKYGVGGVKKFGKLLDCVVSAGLDTEHQNQHLAQGARHIVYQYQNGKKQWVQDTRVMNIHRLFLTAGNRFSPELNIKLITGADLKPDEEQLVQTVAKKAGVADIFKNGKLSLPDGTAESVKQSTPQQLNGKAINQGVVEVNQHFKPIDIEVPHANPTAPTVSKPKLHVEHGTPAVVTSRSVMKNF